MCTTKYITSVYSNGKGLHLSAVITRSDKESIVLSAKVDTEKDAKVIKNFLNRIETFRINDISKTETEVTDK